MTLRGSLLGGSILLATCFASACKDKRHEDMNRVDASAESLENLGKELALSFPPSARLVGAERLNGTDTLRLKGEMSLDDLSPFLSRTPVESEAYAPGSGGYLGRDHGFWDPGTAPKLRTGQTFVRSRALSIGVAEARGVAVLYIVDQGM